MKEEKKETIENVESQNSKGLEPNNSKWLIAFVFVLTVIIVMLVYYICYNNSHSGNNKNSINNNAGENHTNNTVNNKDKDKEDDDNTNLNDEDDELDTDAVLVFAQKNKIGLLDENLNVLWTYDSSDNILSEIITVDGKYIYFFAGKYNYYLYKVDINKQEVEKLRTNFYEPNYFVVEGNLFVCYTFEGYYFGYFKNKQRDEGWMSIKGKDNNKIDLINGNLLFTRKDDGSLNLYNLKTKDNKIIDKSATILASDSNSVLYYNSKNEFNLYNVLEDSKKFIYTGEASGLSFNDKYGSYKGAESLYKNVVYMGKGNSLYTVENGNFTEKCNFQLNDNESISGSTIMVLGNNRYYMSKHTTDLTATCDDEICYGDEKYTDIILDCNTKETKEIDTSAWNDHAVLKYIDN